jgi:3-carboxy-cis,cis-muconate cycloisomerase
VTGVADHGLLDPATLRVRDLADDEAVVVALLDVEVAWAHALAEAAAAPAALPAAVESAVASFARDPSALDVSALATAGEAGGNPVIPLVGLLKDEVRKVDAESASWVHRGLTSQDVLDTALMLVAARTADHLCTDLAHACASLAGLAQTHRGTLMVARTLTQHALPTTFGAKAAGWLEGLLDARERLAAARSALPVQCGGAAGTLALADLATDGRALDVAAVFADRLGLAWPGSPWHANRIPVTGLADALTSVTDALGKVATDVALLVRPEVAELAEPAAAGRGGSSTMPQKRNPVLSVLVRSAALQAPHLAASLHTSAALAADERPDGAWHAEWPVLRRLVLLSAGAAALAAELFDGLQVRDEAMAAHLAQAGPLLLAERLQAELPDRLGGGPEAAARVRDLLAEAAAAADPRAVLRRGIPLDTLTDQELARLLDPRGYLGVTDQLIDGALDRAERLGSTKGMGDRHGE